MPDLNYLSTFSPATSDLLGKADEALRQAFEVIEHHEKIARKAKDSDHADIAHEYLVLISRARQVLAGLDAELPLLPDTPQAVARAEYAEEVGI